MSRGFKTIPLIDRFSSTFFIAILFHAIIIFGITFTDYPSSDTNFSPSFKLTLTTNQNEQKKIQGPSKINQLTNLKPDTSVNVIRAHSKETFTTDAYRVASSLSPENKMLSSNIDIKDSILAAYLNNWRLKVEAIGTKNLPEKNITTSVNPTLEVTVGAKGQLIETVVRHSSGSRSVDQAALNILSLAEPFDPLPESVLQEHEALRFAYEWRFFSNIK